MTNTTQAQIDWHAYITQTPYEAWQNSQGFKAYMALTENWQSIWAFRTGDLRYKNVAKQIIKEKTNPFAIAKGHPPFCFRFQCLTTGRKSKYIKESDYPKFCITLQDAKTGGEYPDESQIQDKAGLLASIIMDKMNKIRMEAFPSTGGLWWQRYSEYLKSEEWHRIRERVLERDGWSCRITGNTKQLQVHHLTYRNVGREQESELITLCREAHEIIHNQSHPMHLAYKAKMPSSQVEATDAL